MKGRNRWSMLVLLVLGLCCYGNAQTNTFSPGDVVVTTATTTDPAPTGVVEWFRPDGTRLPDIPIQGWPADVGFDSFGNMYVLVLPHAEFVQNGDIQTVQKFDNNGRLVDPNFLSFPVPSFPYAGGFRIDKHDNLFVMFSVPPGIVEYSLLTRTVIGTFSINSSFLDVSADERTMWHLGPLPCCPDLYKLDIATQASTDLGPLPSSDSEYLRIMPDGNILVANGNFWRYAGGVAASIVGPAGGPPLRSYYIPSPTGHTDRLAFDPDGTSFWALDAIAPMVFKVDIASGNVLASFGVGAAPPWIFGLAVFPGISNVVPPGLALPPTQGISSEPVTTGNGNYFYQHADLLMPGRGIPLVFQRSYNTLDNYHGPLGANWTHSFNIFLTQTLTGAVIKWGDGRGETFTLSGGVYVPQPGVFSTLLQNPDGTFVLTQKNQTRYLFSAGGSLTNIIDKNGNTILLTYDGGGNLTQITDTVGRNSTFSYDGSKRITQITDPIGRTETLSYSGTNDLAQVTDPAGGLTQFAYDASHHVASITLPNSQTLLQNTYDSAGRVITQINGRGFTTTFAYNTPSSGQTTITDARGNQTVHTYDSSLRIVTITDAQGGVVGYTYDANNDRTSVANQNGNTTTFAYDGDGNLTSITDPLGNSSGFTYDARNDLLTATNPKGKTTTFSYDAKGNLRTIQDALGNTTTFAYDGSGQLSSKTDARSHVASYGYDSFGNLNQITDALGNITTLAYDGIGRLNTLTDPNHHTATSAYDSLSRLTTVTDPLGHQTKFAYDAVGNLQKITDAKGDITTYGYDAVNNLVTVTDALGHVTQYAYDPNNNRTAFTNAKGNGTSYAYDDLNRLSAVTDPLSFVTTYAYDSVGNVKAVKDANGKTNQFAYDQLNRLIGISHADGENVTYAYDADGNRTSMLDSHGTTLYAYDDLDRLTNVTYPGGKTVAYGHDAVGNRDSLTYPDSKIVSYAYDAGNRLAGVTDWLGKTTGYSYDAASNLLATAYPNKAAISFAYDAANRLTSVVNSIRGVPAVVIAYTLDAVGNRTKESVDGVATAFGYDALNQLVSVQLGPLKGAWTYDAVGNRLKQTSPLGTVAYTYDAGDRLLTAGLAKFTYDNNGNQVAKTSGKLTGTYAYDAANRLVQALGYGMNSTFGYDGDGNRISQTNGSSTYGYLNDVATALPVVLNEQGPDGNITYAYGLGLIEESSPKFNYFYHYDGLGSVIALTDANGKPQAAYAYDPWGSALLSVTDNVGSKNKFRFTGEALDPGTGFYYLRARYYDPSLSRFMRKDPLLGLVYQPRTMHPYLYVGNNPLLLKDPLGLCPDCVQSTLSPAPQLSAAQQYDNDMLVRGDDIIEQQITNTILEAAGAALSLVGSLTGIPGLGSTVSLVLQRPTELQRIEAFSDWAVDNTLLQTPSGRYFLQLVGEGKVTAILLSEAVYNTQQELQRLDIPPDVISLVLSGLDVK